MRGARRSVNPDFPLATNSTRSKQPALALIPVALVPSNTSTRSKGANEGVPEPRDPRVAYLDSDLPSGLVPRAWTSDRFSAPKSTGTERTWVVATVAAYRTTTMAPLGRFMAQCGKPFLEDLITSGCPYFERMSVGESATHAP